MSLVLLFVWIAAVVTKSASILKGEYVNTTLNALQSPYYINSPIIVHDILLISDGVHIIFNASIASIQVIGELNACLNGINTNTKQRGTVSSSSNTITITSSSPNNDNPLFNIRVDLGANALFCNTQFETVTNAINIGCNGNDCSDIGGGSLQFYNSNFQNIDKTFLFLNGTMQTSTTSNIIIHNSIFQNVNDILTQYNKGQDFKLKTNIDFENCLFNDFEHIFTNYTKTSAFTNSQINGNGAQTCLTGGLGTLTNVNITNCGIAIDMKSSNIIKTGFDIYYSNLSNNNIAVIAASYSVIYGTNFINNTINIQNPTDNDRLFEFNYWGTTDESVIVNKIYDICDDEMYPISSGLVIWWPYLTAEYTNNGNNNTSAIEAVSKDIKEKSLRYCGDHILLSMFDEELINYTLSVDNSPYYIVSDVITCDLELVMDAGIKLVFTGDYILYISGDFRACDENSNHKTMSLYTGRNYGNPHDKETRGVIMIDAANGADAHVCDIHFNGMTCALDIVSGGSGDSIVNIGYCSFTNLGSAIGSYHGPIPGIAEQMCRANYTSTLLPQSTLGVYTTTANTDHVIGSTLTSEITTVAAVSTTKENTKVISPTATRNTETSVSSSTSSGGNVTVVIKPTENSGFNESESGGGTSDNCSVLDTEDYIILEGQCESCGVPIFRGKTVKCLKEAYYEYYDLSYNIDWELDDMFCEYLIYKIENGKGNIGDGDDDDSDDNGHSTKDCTVHKLQFQLDIVFHSQYEVKQEYDNMNDGGIDNYEYGNSIASYLKTCDKHFEDVECSFTEVSSNIPYSPGSGNAACTLGSNVSMLALLVLLLL